MGSCDLAVSGLTAARVGGWVEVCTVPLGDSKRRVSLGGESPSAVEPPCALPPSFLFS